MKTSKEPIRIYVEYEEHRSGGEAYDPEDRWTSHSDVNVDVRFILLHREKPTHRFFYDSIELPNDKMFKMGKLFLAVVRYGTGDTFGHTNGAWYIVGVAPTYKIAQAMLDDETKPSPEPAKGEWQRYKRWEGYFESLDGTEIHELSLV
jgi:hypothetical protein